VTVINGESNKVIATLRVGSYPWALCYNPQDNKVYCTNERSYNVSVIDGASDSVVKTIAVGTFPRALTCNPAQNRMYVTNILSNSVSIIRDSALGVVEHTPLVGRPVALEVYPNPFSGQVRLQLTASGSRPVVRVYDVNGVLVRTFPQFAVRSPQFESPRFLTWDGTDGLNRRLPNGVYICRVSDGSRTVATRELTLLHE
jgi:YVTN family beta-propeller protein